MGLTTQPNIECFCLKSPQGVKASAATFDKLEAYLSTLKGRKFYGVMYGKPPEGEYYACVTAQEDDELENTPLKKMTIPGGLYAQQVLKNWSKNTNKIATTFQQLASTQQIDPERPSVEHYQSMRKMYCRVAMRT